MIQPNTVLNFTIRCDSSRCVEELRRAALALGKLGDSKPESEAKRKFLRFAKSLGLDFEPAAERTVEKITAKQRHLKKIRRKD